LATTTARLSGTLTMTDGTTGIFDTTVKEVGSGAAMSVPTLAGTVTFGDGTVGNFSAAVTVGGTPPVEPPVEPPIEPPPAGVNPGAPPPPPQPAVLPGSSGRIHNVGNPYRTVKEAIDHAEDGDIIVIPAGTPRESFVIHKILLVDGTGVSWDFADMPAGDLVYQGKAAIVASSPGWHIKGMTVSGAGIRESTHTLIAAIRCDAAGYGIIEGCHLVGNQNGIAADTGPLWDITIANCALHGNGLGDGLTHNIYVNDGYAIRLHNTDSVDPVEGYALKSRAWHTFVAGGTLRNSTASLIDCANGGLLSVSGTTMEKPANSPNRRIISYGLEYSDKGLLDSNVVAASTMQLDCNDTFIQLQGGTLTFAADCEWHGQTPAVDGGGTVVGLP
jgi:hypothetical protein